VTQILHFIKKCRQKNCTRKYIIFC